MCWSIATAAITLHWTRIVGLMRCGYLISNRGSSVSGAEAAVPMSGPTLSEAIPDLRSWGIAPIPEEQRPP